MKHPCSTSRGQGSLEYVLIIGGAILFAAAVFIIVTSGPVAFGKDFLEDSVDQSQKAFVGAVEENVKDAPEISLFFVDPQSLTITDPDTGIDSTICVTEINYTATDDLTSPVDMFIHVAIGSDEIQIQNLVISDYDIPDSFLGTVDFIPFLGALTYTNHPCGTIKSYKLRACDLGFNCTLSDVVTITT